MVLDAIADAAATGWAGRQVRRLFGAARLGRGRGPGPDDVRSAACFRGVLAPHVARLQSAGALEPEAAQRWWAALDERAGTGWFTGGVTWFLVAGYRAGVTRSRARASRLHRAVLLLGGH